MSLFIGLNSTEAHKFKWRSSFKHIIFLFVCVCVFILWVLFLLFGVFRFICFQNSCFLLYISLISIHENITLFVIEKFLQHAKNMYIILCTLCLRDNTASYATRQICKCGEKAWNKHEIHSSLKFLLCSYRLLFMAASYVERDKSLLKYISRTCKWNEKYFSNQDRYKH